MKTLTVLLVAVFAARAVPASAQTLQETLHCAAHAHQLAAEIAARTLPHAHCSADWSRAAERAVATDAAAEAVLGALTVGDYCTARDAADRLKDLADDLQDDAEDLSPVASQFGRRFGRDEVRQIERLANDLEDHARNLRRETRRLDARSSVTGPPVGPIYGAPVAPGGFLPQPVRPTPDYGFFPGGTPRGLQNDWRYDQQPRYEDRRPAVVTPPAALPYDGSFGPGQSVPPAGFGLPAPSTLPGPMLPDQGFRSIGHPFADQSAHKPAVGRVTKIPQRQPGPRLFAPNASLGIQPHR